MTTDYSQPTYEPAAGWDPYPATEAGWRELYDLRWQMYMMSPYGGGQQRGEHLFRAFDDSGNEIDQTRRIFRYFGFIADTDAAALAGTDIALETAGRRAGTSRPAQLDAGEVVWRRSRVATQAPLWFTMLCGLGDYCVEAVRTSPRPPYRTRLVGYDPRLTTLVYDDETGMELVEARICIDNQNPTERRDGKGAPTTDRYERVLTRGRIDIYRNGVLSEGESGPHNAGVVPLVHLRCLPWDQPEHSLCAAAGVERGLMKLDSLATQISAIGTRYGNPTMVVRGAKLGANSRAQRFGYMIDGVPADGAVEYLEAKFANIPALLQHMQALHSHIRDTSPEFLFASDAAQESAEARSLRGQAFEAKMRSMRGRVYGALAEITGVAVAMDQNRAFDLGESLYKIEAPPILPRNIKVELESLELVKSAIKRADYVRHLQRLGMVGMEHDPEAYAAEVQDETAARAAAFFTEPAAPVASTNAAEP